MEGMTWGHEVLEFNRMYRLRWNLVCRSRGGKGLRVMRCEEWAHRDRAFSFARKHQVWIKAPKKH